MLAIDAISDFWLLILPAGVFLLVWSAERLVDGSVVLARLLGISTLVIGLTIVAAGTSAPELAVNVIAALGGNTALSFGNVVGSNIANIGLVIGLGAIVMPIAVHSRVIQRELPWLFGVSLVCCVLPLNPLGKPEGVVGYGRLDGVALFAMFLLFLWLWYRAGREHGEDPLAQEAHERVMEVKADRPLRASMLVLLGCIGLFLGGFLTKEGAVGCAKAFGMSEALIGLTVVALATSLPEAVTVLAAARKNQADLAVGNVVGSNVFNLLFVLGITSGVAGVPVPSHGWEDLGVMLVLTLILWFFCWFRSANPRVSRAEGIALLAMYIVYMGWGVAREKMFG